MNASHGAVAVRFPVCVVSVDVVTLPFDFGEERFYVASQK
jgi:hypothetical protein